MRSRSSETSEFTYSTWVALTNQLSEKVFRVFQTRGSTKEKLYIVGGPEFEELQGHVLVVDKALYGTRSGGACWHDKLFDILHQMGFKPSKADPDIRMKSSKDDNHYEYCAVYVDDLAIPRAFCDTLKEKYKLKLKGVGPISYHLGCGYTRDEDGTLASDPRKSIC